ncbi:MAG: apolipoprotein N-acyltransferase [Bacteroidales bacterium]|nr:apolipoprotein N-acyltransferase [Bacteroidales bacterium]
MFQNRKEFIGSIFLVILSGALTGLSLLYIVHWLAWVMLIPLFFTVIKQPKGVFLKGFMAGTITGLILFSWMIASFRLYTGTAPYIGYPLWLLCSFFLGAVTGLSLKLFIILSIKNTPKHGWWLNALVAASLWVIVDWVRVHLLTGIPWVNYPLAFTQSKWAVPLQITSLTGIWGLTFIIVAVNVMFACIINNKSYKSAWLPAALISCLLLFGLIKGNPSDNAGKKKVKVALICENTEARTRWLPENSDSLAAIYFSLNEQAARLNPQLIVWSESAIPWNLAMDDDLITKCLHITWPSKAAHIIGIFTPSELYKDKKFNSAYYIEPDGAITSRYDKVRLLSFLEHPFAGAKIPFFNKSAISDIIPGKEHNLLRTAFGNAGILICNEIISQQPYRKTIRLRPQFFTVISNNAWFEGSRLYTHHFFYIRMRAVESGKDIVVNCNRGISGIIHANGKTQAISQGNIPTVASGYVNLSRSQSFYARNGDWFILMAALFTITILLSNLFTIKSK